MDLIAKLFDKRAAPILSVLFVVLFVLEQKRKLRKITQPLKKRIPTNAIVAIPAFVLLRLLFLPLMVKLAFHNKYYEVGRQLNLPPILRWVITFLILDYGNYLWHVVNHKIPLLWRFHLVHHTDLDLDTTTAFRFHFGEMIGSVFSRGLFVLLANASAKQVLYYELLFEAATQFHHSNIKIPIKKDNLLNKLIVTPRMHGIHHSVNKDETNSNYSVIFSFWDRIHRTFNAKPKQQQLIIGVPAYRDAKLMTPTALWSMPFKKQVIEKPN
ncbi:sterol desaturase [Arcticibacter svalbardensis MN12-7]|uniref:Sterol desaturase n=1 Tax=Arcticibacter svalbardensis MN12-7 TaxID=1150600 RepID=R9GMM2_9SPHI|nr:sterol desaturase family protein [Arcticibacter svalbardensis]EOR92978.1 sterol desaturase [Arcticibacter svalbardensis MN12-7]